MDTSSSPSLVLTQGAARIFSVGALSWTSEPKETGYLSKGEFLRSVEAASIGGRVDLVVCALRGIGEVPKRNELLQRTGGSAALFQTYEGATWLVSDRGVWKVRKRQRVAFKKDPEHRYLDFSERLAKGRGLIELSGIDDVRLVVLLCGENNVIQYSSQSSVFSRMHVPAAKERLSSSWIAINPAHRPYAKNLTQGYTKVAELSATGPSLRKIVARREKFRDGTVAPEALLHVNNFLVEDDSLASVLFERTASGAARGTGRTVTKFDGVVGLRYTEYQLRLPRGNSPAQQHAED